MSRVHKLRTVATMLMPVSILAFAVSMSMATVVGADTTSCVYIGYAFVDDQAVPAGTGIRILEDSMVLEDTTTGLDEELGDNQFFLTSVVAEVGTEVNFEIWFDGADEWLPADETAIHKESGWVEVDLHAWSGTPVTPGATPTTAPTATPTASPTQDATPKPTPGGGGLSGGAIAGIVIGLLIALGLAMWVVIRGRKKSEIPNKHK